MNLHLPPSFHLDCRKEMVPLGREEKKQDVWAAFQGISRLQARKNQAKQGLQFWTAIVR